MESRGSRATSETDELCDVVHREYDASLLQVSQRYDSSCGLRASGRIGITRIPRNSGVQSAFVCGQTGSMIVSAIDGWLHAKQHGNASTRVSKGLPSSNDRDCRCVLDVRSSLSKYFVQEDATYHRVILYKMIVMQQSSVSCMPEYSLQHFSQFRRTPPLRETISKHASALPLARAT